MKQLDVNCCDEMRAQLDHACDRHSASECPDRVVVLVGGRPALPIRDGGSSGIEIRYCPWCGREVAT